MLTGCASVEMGPAEKNVALKKFDAPTNGSKPGVFMVGAGLRLASEEVGKTNVLESNYAIDNIPK